MNNRRIGHVALTVGTLGALTGCVAPGVRVSERFGYDREDATKAVQAALDSGERHLILDRQSADWFVRPLRVTGRTDLTIEFEDGAYLMAKRGAFRGPIDTLLTFTGCTNITLRGAAPERCGLRMWHDDYLNLDKREPNAMGYRWSEWRHGLSFLSCANVTLEGISSNDSGGDGLYVSTSDRAGGQSCANVTIRNCIFDHNNRQGISVIGSRGFVVEDTLLSNTYGTAPAAGIDFEPNKAHEAITGIVMRRCRAVNNQGSGFEFYLGNLDHSSAPIDALFEDCLAVSNKVNFCYAGGSRRPDMPYAHGRIAVTGCRFEGALNQGIRIGDHPYGQGEFLIRDTVLRDNCRAGGKCTDISVGVTGHGGHEPNRITFDRVTVIRPKAGRVINKTARAKPFAGRPTVLSGTVNATVAGKAETHVFDAAWNAKNHPYRVQAASAIARVTASLDGVTVTDRRPGEMLAIAEPVFFRGRGQALVFYADRARSVHFKLLQTLIGKHDYRAPSRPVRIFRYGSKTPLPGEQTVPADPNGGVIAFAVPAKGFYALELPTGGNGVAVTACDVPLAYDASRDYVNFVGPGGGKVSAYRKGKGVLHFAVPDRTSFAVLCTGEGTEMVGLEIADPAGKVVQREDALTDINVLDVNTPAGGVWTLRTFRPSEGVFEDYNLSLAGVPGWLFVSPDRYWR